MAIVPRLGNLRLLDRRDLHTRFCTGCAGTGDLPYSEQDNQQGEEPGLHGADIYTPTGFLARRTNYDPITPSTR